MEKSDAGTGRLLEAELASFVDSVVEVWVSADDEMPAFGSGLVVWFTVTLMDCLAVLSGLGEPSACGEYLQGAFSR